MNKQFIVNSAFNELKLQDQFKQYDILIKLYKSDNLCIQDK